MAASTAFRAFRSRNYRLFFAGQSLSLLGTWMQKTAVSWVVYSLTQSKWMLGVSVFATLFPSALFAIVGGAVADRHNRYRVLLLTQVLSLGQAGALALAVWWWPQALWSIIGLSAALGVVNAFDTPARQSLVYEMVENKADLPNAVALNSSMVNLSKMLGPAVAGLALEKLGASACFGLNALSFVAVISSLLLMRLPAQAAPARARNLLADTLDGLRYVRDTPHLRFIMLMLALVSLLALPFTVLLPVFAKDIFHGTATTFGLLDGSVGLGALLGALYLALQRPDTNLARVLTVNTFIFGAGLLLVAYAPWLELALLCLGFSAFGMMAQTTVSITLLQTTVAPAMRGRVVSLYVLIYASLVPLGSLLAGVASEHVGVRATVLAEGVLTLLIGGLYLRDLRRSATPASPARAADVPAPQPA